MEMSSVNELFEYLNSLEQVNIQPYGNSVRICVSGKIVLQGNKVEKIDHEKLKQLQNKNDFLYSDNEIIHPSTYNYDRIDRKPDSFLTHFFSDFPHVIPKEYKLQSNLAYLQAAFIEMREMRINLKKREIIIQELKDDLSKLTNKIKNINEHNSELQHALNKKSIQLLEAIYNINNTVHGINNIQINAIYDFIQKMFKSNGLYKASTVLSHMEISTGYVENIARLSYKKLEANNSTHFPEPIYYLSNIDDFQYFDALGNEIKKELYYKQDSGFSFGYNELLMLLKKSF
jgi:hypothetical protein